MFVEKFLNSKRAEFYLRGINKLADKWKEVIQNNDDRILLIEINTGVKSFMNK